VTRYWTTGSAWGLAMPEWAPDWLNEDASIDDDKLYALAIARAGLTDHEGVPAKLEWGVRFMLEFCRANTPTSPTGCKLVEDMAVAALRSTTP